jgi:hypothetical protein
LVKTHNRKRVRVVNLGKIEGRTVEYCAYCKKTGQKVEAGHFVGPKSSTPTLVDKRGQALCDFHWWMMFERLPSGKAITWVQYLKKWGKGDYPGLTFPPKQVQNSELAKLKKKHR